MPGEVRQESHLRLAASQEVPSEVGLSVVFGSLDPFSMTEFILVRLKGAEYKDWMAYRYALRRVLVSGVFSMTCMVEVVGNIIGVWPLIVSFLKETRRKTNGNSLVVQYTSWVCFRVQCGN